MTPSEWLGKMRRLNVDRATGNPAPHKPVLLLVVLDLARESALPSDRLPLTPDLMFRFSAYWPIVGHRRTSGPDIRLPFHHLQSDGCWTALATDGKPSRHRTTTASIQLDPELRALLMDSDWCDKARRALIETYFQPSEQIALYETQGMQPPTEEVKARESDEATSPAREQGREARFRIEVVTAYDFTCALTGYRLMTLSAGTIVDAAHIHRFADSRNNALQNGYSGPRKLDRPVSYRGGP